MTVVHAASKKLKIVITFTLTILIIVFAFLAIINHGSYRENIIDLNLSKNDINHRGSVLSSESNFSFFNKYSQTNDKNYKSAIRDKESREIKIAMSTSEVISQLELYEALIRNKAEIDPDMELRMKNNAMTAADWEQIDIYAASLLSTEENFKIELSQYKDFAQLKNAFESRANETGYFYGTDLLSQPNAYIGATFEDVKKIIDSGARLPDDFLKKAVYANNLDLAIKLEAAGYNFNKSFIDTNKSMNAIESQVESYAINPFGSSPEEKINNIKKLIDIGVPLKIKDGTRDALDLALQGAYLHDGAEADSLMFLAKNLHSLGIELEDSSYELLEKIKNKNPELYDQYIKSFQ